MSHGVGYHVLFVRSQHVHHTTVSCMCRLSGAKGTECNAVDMISTLGASNQFAQHVEAVQQKNMILQRLLCCGERRRGMKIRDKRYESEHCIDMVVDCP